MKKQLVWKYILDFKYVIALLIFAVIIGFVGESSMMNRIKQKAEIARLQNEIDLQIEKFNADKEKLNELRNNPEAVRDVAHEDYHMKNANEDVFVIEDE